MKGRVQLLGGLELGVALCSQPGLHICSGKIVEDCVFACFFVNIRGPIIVSMYVCLYPQLNRFLLVFVEKVR